MTLDEVRTGTVRLTQLSSGGGCSCKIGAGPLEELLGQVFGPGAGGAKHISPAWPGAALACGLDAGDDAAVVTVGPGPALVATTDFFPPMVDDPYDWGRIAAANALSDIYAMGATPVVALNLLCWPDELTSEIAAAVLRGGKAVTDEAGCLLAGGHSIVDPVPKYGLAVTGLVDPDRALRNDAARAGDPISLTKPLGVGVLNNWHKTTGTPIPQAVGSMASLNREASCLALEAGARAATDVTGFGLLGHLYKMARASGVSATVSASAVPYLDGARDAAQSGHIPGGTRRNLEWAWPHLRSDVDELDLVLLADAQTSGGLLVAGEVPGYPVIGQFIPAGPGGPELFVGP
jgi:selenide,water dikinase